INNRSVIGGASGNHIIEWSPTGIIEMLPPSQWSVGAPRRMNNVGNAVSYGFNTRDGERAFLWTPSESWINLGSLGIGTSEAYGINDRDDVVGISYDSGVAQSWLWTR